MELKINLVTNQLIIPNDLSVKELRGYLVKALKVCPNIKEWSWAVDKDMTTYYIETDANTTSEPHN
jgi:hypothetical protein